MGRRILVAGFVGTGTRQDPFRPDIDLAADESVAVIDLSANPAAPTACLAVVEWPGASRVLRGKFDDLGEDELAAISATLRNKIANRLGIDPSLLLTPGDICLAVLGSKLAPERDGMIRVRCGSLILSERPLIKGGATDSFTYSNGSLATVSSGVWVRHTIGGSGGTWSVASNVVTVPSEGPDGFYRWSTAMGGADHYSQCSAINTNTTNATDCVVGPTTRMGTTTTNVSCYAGMMGTWSGTTNGTRYMIWRLSSGSFTNLTNNAGTSGTRTVRLESEGSTHRLYVDASLINSTTDSNHTNTSVGLVGYEYGSGATPSIDNWEGDVLAGGTDATATPATIVAGVTMDGPTETAGSTTTPATIITAATFDAPTESTSETGTPATIIAAASLDAVTPQRSETSTPATIIAAVTVDAVTASGTSNATPTPATIAVIAALDAVAASGGTNATATPAEIVATAALDAVTASGTSNATPTPDAIIVPVSLDAVTATGGSASTATPAAIIATAALDAVSPSAGSTVTVTEIVALASFDAATATGESNATPAPNAIVAVVTLDAVTATGGSAGTASPATITATASFDAPAYTAGGTASPAALEVLAVLPVVFATGNGVFAPGSIVVVIRRQDRTLDVEAVSRVYTVPARSRTLEATDAD